MTSDHPSTAARAGANPDDFKLQAWYCPALAAYRRPGEQLLGCWAHLLTQFEWVPLYAVAGADVAVSAGWTLRSYYSPAEAAFYGSHRTMSEKTTKQVDLMPLYAPPGSLGNGTAGHVPPKK